MELVRSGLERVAEAIDAHTEAVALVGGEGARRLAALVRAVRLPGEGDEAVRSAIGFAAAGGRCVLLASGDAVAHAVTSLRELARSGVAVDIVVPSHGGEDGHALPASDPDPIDTAVLRALFHGESIALVDAEIAAAVEAIAKAERARVPRVVSFSFFPDGLMWASGPCDTAGPTCRIEFFVPTELHATWFRTVLGALAASGTRLTASFDRPYRAAVYVYTNGVWFPDLFVFAHLPRDPCPEALPGRQSHDRVAVFRRPGAPVVDVGKGAQVFELLPEEPFDDRHLVAGVLRAFAGEKPRFDELLAPHAIDVATLARVGSVVADAIGALRR